VRETPSTTNERLKTMNPWDTVTLTLSVEQAELVKKTAIAEERRIQRQINRFQNKIDMLYNLKYAASDFAYVIEQKVNNVKDGYSY
jgi:hypothetical protein